MGRSESDKVGRRVGDGVDVGDADEARNADLTPAPKARKKRGRGNVWTTVTATPEQRVIITERADRAGMSVSSYLVQCGLKTQVVRRSNWQQAVAQLTEVNTRLAEVSALLEDRATPLDAVRLSVLLCRIEDAARGLLTPGQKAIARIAEDIDFASLVSVERAGASGEDVEATDENVSRPEDDRQGGLAADADLSDGDGLPGGHC